MELRFYFKKYNSNEKRFELCDKSKAESISVFVEDSLDTLELREKIYKKVEEFNSKFALVNSAKGRADGVRGTYLNFAKPKYETVTL